MDFYNAVMFVIAVIFVVIQGLIVNYLLKLESIGCQCAMDWRRGFIIFYLILSIVYALLPFFLKKEDIPILQTAMVVFGIVNVVVTLQYVYRLKKEKCNCSESIYREIITIVAIFNAILYSFLLVLLIFLLFSLATFAKNNKTALGLGKKSVSIKPLKDIIKKKVK